MCSETTGCGPLMTRWAFGQRAGISDFVFAFCFQAGSLNYSSKKL
jgi:hypothetical protein